MIKLKDVEVEKPDIHMSTLVKKVLKHGPHILILMAILMEPLLNVITKKIKLFTTIKELVSLKKMIPKL